ncbi:hypothetical protein KKC61_00395 [Patescibacteria group bacterium]|nr:hypothetical protein [Patescibacteria group bacterium]
MSQAIAPRCLNPPKFTRGAKDKPPQGWWTPLLLVGIYYNSYNWIRQAGGAINYMEKEKGLDILNVLINMARKKGGAGGATPENIEKFIQATKAAFEKRKTKIEVASEQWVKKIRDSKNEANRAAAKEEIQVEAYDKRSPEEIDILKDQLSVAATKGDLPTWLAEETTYIQQSDVAAEFVARIAMLPAEQQQNPYILYRELYKMHNSINWIAQSNRSLMEISMITNKALVEIRSQAANKGILELENLNSVGAFIGDRTSTEHESFDLYRLDKLKETEDPGQMPDSRKERDKYGAWREKEIKKRQRRVLEETLVSYQKDLDGGLLSTKDELQRMKDLDKLLTKSMSGSREDKGLQARYKELNSEDVSTIKRRIQQRVRALEAQHEREYKSQKLIEEAEREDRKTAIYKTRKLEETKKKRDELARNGDAIIWIKELKARYPNCAAEIDDIIYVRGLNKGDIDLIISGSEGRWEWFSKFWQEVYTFGDERVRPSLQDEYKWHEFRRIIELVDPESLHEISKFKDFWERIGKIDGIAKAFFLPGSYEDKAKGLKYLLPNDMQTLFRTFEHSEYSYSIMKSAIMDKLRRRFAQFDKDAVFLNGSVSDSDMVLLKDGAPDIYDEFIALQKTGKPAKRDLLLVRLQEKYAHRDESGDIVGFGDLPSKLVDLKNDIQKARDDTGAGLFLRDYDMLSNNSMYGQLSDLTLKVRESLTVLENGYEESGVGKEYKKTDLTTARREEIDEEIVSLKRKLNEGWKILTDNPNDTTGFDEHKLNAVRGFSPTLIETRERLIKYLQVKEKIKPENFHGWLKNNEWKVRNACLAAQYASLGWGDVLDIAARVARAPTLDFDSAVLKVAGRDIMPAAFAEPAVRVLNPELFEDRFMMRGKFGQEIREQHYRLMFERFAPDFMKNMPKSVKNQIDQLRKEGKPSYKILIKAAADYYAVPYTELLRPGFLRAGSHLTNTTHRFEIAMLQPYRDMMMKLKAEAPEGDKWVINNQALSLQLALADPLDEDVGVHERIAILTKMLGRTPSRFIQMSGTDLYDLAIKRGLDMQSVEWYGFQQALSNAEIEAWDDEEGLNVKRVDFTTNKDFNAILRPHLEASGITDKGRQNVYHQFLVDLHEYASTKDSSGRNLIGKWARHTFAMTLPLTDYNIKNARPELLTAFINERRINDQLAMAEAASLQYQLLEPSLISPPTQDYSKHIETLLKFRNIINTYDAPEVAEMAASVIADGFVWVNMDRSMYNVIGWIPLSKKIMRGIAEWDWRIISKSKDNKFLNKITNGAWKDLAEHKIVEWPHTVAGAVSIATKYLGGEALALNANEIGQYVSTTEAAGVFTHLRNIPKDIRKKYGTGVLMRFFYHLPRRYWWVVPVATIAMAAMQSVEEETKQQHH